MNAGIETAVEMGPDIRGRADGGGGDATALAGEDRRIFMEVREEQRRFLFLEERTWDVLLTLSFLQIGLVGLWDLVHAVRRGGCR